MICKTVGHPNNLTIYITINLFKFAVSWTNGTQHSKWTILSSNKTWRTMNKCTQHTKSIVLPLNNMKWGGQVMASYIAEITKTWLCPETSSPAIGSYSLNIILIMVQKSDSLSIGMLPDSHECNALHLAKLHWHSWTTRVLQLFPSLHCTGLFCNQDYFFLH